MHAYAADRSLPRLRSRRAIGALAACLAALTIVAAAPAGAAPKPASPAADIPLPPPRPEISPAKPNSDQSNSDKTSSEKTSSDADAVAAVEIPSPPPRPPDLEKPVPLPPSAEVVAEDNACRERLLGLGVRFEPLPLIADGQCGAPLPLRVSALPDGIGITAPATLVCAAVEALARWTREVVAVEAVRHLEAQPSRIAIGTSYQCRTQNHRPGAKLSEHAFANGVDISGFEFKGRKAVIVTDHPAGTPEALFLGAVRSQACTYFTTVLGPGSDAAHADHLHLDLRGRGRGFRMCQ
jgi:hypothetical protein